MIMTHAFETAAEALTFLSAGNATVTLTSAKTGSHFTFKAKKPTLTTERGGKVRDHDATIVFVDGLHGDPSNWEDWHQLGFFFVDEKGISPLRRSKKATGPKSDSFAAFEWTLRQLVAGNLSDQLTIEHSGKCCRCGKTITHPDSLALGIGPECAKHF
jgi:hypothetical protein